MRRMITMAAALFLASSALGSPAFANNGNGNGGGNGGGNGNGGGHGNSFGASGMAPGQMKAAGESARPSGQLREGFAARSFAPGQMKKAADDDTTASVRTNYGTLISLIRSGKGDVSDVSSDIVVNIVDVDDLKTGDNLQALENALEANSLEVEDLRAELEDMEIDGLDEVDLNSVVAADVAADGSLIVFVD